MPPKVAQGRRLTRENIEETMSSSKKSSEDTVPMPQTTHAQMRRQSKWDRSLMDRRYSTASRTSISGSLTMKMPTYPVKHENTYKLEPDDKFECHKAQNIMLGLLKDWLAGVKYSPNVRTLSTGLTEEIKRRVKALGFKRYKYVVTVTICQDAKQSMQMVSRCIWNKDTDNYAEAVFKTADICAIATLYALYFE